MNGVRANRPRTITATYTVPDDKQSGDVMRAEAPPIERRTTRTAPQGYDKSNDDWKKLSGEEQYQWKQRNAAAKSTIIASSPRIAESNPLHDKVRIYIMNSLAILACL